MRLLAGLALASLVAVACSPTEPPPRTAAAPASTSELDDSPMPVIDGTQPVLREGPVEVRGTSRPAEIVSVIRRNFGAFRLCYEKGLAKDPKLGGTVTTKLAIDTTGVVTAAEDGGSDLPDKDVVACVVSGFSKLAFPKPDAGIVLVVYRMTFKDHDIWRPKTPDNGGRLPPDEIKRIVTQATGRFRLCYDQGRKKSPSLEGRLFLKVVIDEKGAVRSVTDLRAELPDNDVVACVIREFSSLTFPAPEGGPVTVLYPMVFHQKKGE